MLTLKQLRHLQAVVRHGSIHRAADTLHVTPPALTRSLAILEEELGVQLFDRSKTGMHPTPFCDQILARCVKLLLDVDDLLREASLYRKVDTGRLNLGVGRGIREISLRPVLPEFISLYPKIQIHITEGSPEELVKGLRNRQFDLLLASFNGVNDSEGLRVQELKSVPSPIFVRSGHPLQDKKGVSLLELYEYPMLSASQLAPNHPISQYLAKPTGLPPEVHLLSSDYELLKQTLLRTNAWLPAPVSQLSAELRSGELVILDVPGWAFTAQISTIELSGRTRSPAAQHFIDLCMQSLDRW
ncbi:LysR family transcriptional regulator [Pseudomonas sp. TTU2014-080ASC]|uniref:LysR family transcriptional regulator n=1 Tax=Pseudomonas sp. TTU2014-080ASC TaxID=1729724 RepID=UPI0009E93551|nr:LysR family transcriptional regulator [Pseudomonas sp. TTU2014-080ASC]